MNRPPHPLARRHGWRLPVLSLALLAGHVLMLYYLSSRVVLSAAMLSGAVLLLIITHRQLSGQLYALLQRRRRGTGPPQDG